MHVDMNQRQVLHTQVVNRNQIMTVQVVGSMTQSMAQLTATHCCLLYQGSKDTQNIENARLHSNMTFTTL